MDNQATDVHQEVVDPVQHDHVSDVNEAAPDQETYEQAQEDPQEKNWRELRNALKELKRENQALRHEVNRIHEPKQRAVEEDEDDDDYSDGVVTPKHLQKAISRIEQKLYEKEKSSVEDRLRAKYSDFDDVFTQENIEYLQKNDPELALSLRALSNDPYKQAIAAYKLLRKTDYFLQNTSQDKVKIAQNQTKPTSVQSVRKQGALAEANRFANGLTKDLKEQLWKEMQQYSKGS